MRIVADIEAQDYWLYNKFAMLHLPGMKNAFLMNFAGIHLTVFMMMMLLKEPLLTSILACIFLGLAADAVVIYMFRKRVWKTAETGRGIVGRHIFEIAENGISDRTGEHQTFFQWGDVTGVERAEHGIYIFFDRNFAHILPLRSFKDSDEQELFLETIKKYREVR